MIKLLIISEVSSFDTDYNEYKESEQSWYDWVKQLPGFIKFDAPTGTRWGQEVNTNANITVCEVYFNNNNNADAFLNHSTNIESIEKAKQFAKWIKIIKVKIDE